MAMENPPFMGDFPIETSICRGFSIATFDYRRVVHEELALASSTEPFFLCTGPGKRLQKNVESHHLFLRKSTISWLVVTGT